MNRVLRATTAGTVLAGMVLAGAVTASGSGGGRPAERDIPYRLGAWNPETLGNHRALVRVASAADAVRVHIPWRRRDKNPALKHLIIVAAKSGQRVLNLSRIAIDRESGDLAFQAAEAGDYFVYYLPNSGAGRSNYPKVTYPRPEQTAEPAWLARHGLAVATPGKADWNALPEAAVVEFQAVDELNSFYPMEVIATAEETRTLLAKHPGAPYLVFPEDRRFPIRMADDLPQRWIAAGANQPFHGEAARGEFYAFQVGVFAVARRLDDVRVTFSGVTARSGGAAIPASAFRCTNTGGTNWDGRPMSRPVTVERGKVQALWMGVDLPGNVAPGDYEGTVTIAPRDAEPTPVRIVLSVSNEAAAARGDNEPWRHSRLRWLDSTIAFDDDVVPPYTPVRVTGTTVGVLGRTVTVGANGFPSSIKSYFAAEMTRLSDAPREVLAGPIALVVDSAEPEVTPWSGATGPIVKQGQGAAAWSARSTAGPLKLATRARMEFDGTIEFEVEVGASRPTVVSDIRLEIPLAPDVARYMLGLGYKGGSRPERYDWSWEPTNNHDSAWIGDANAGLQFTLKDDKYERPLNTNFYQSKPLVMPASWDNGGKGGCHLRAGEAAYTVSCYSGPRVVRPAQTLRYDFRLMVTPFKPIDTRAHFSTRYFHQYKPIDEVIASGANTINIHHATAINPWINYPFLTPKELGAYVDQAHAKGLKVKIYNTVRELSNHAPELFALRSLGTEILSPGPGGGFSWLQEHVESNYIAAWFVPQIKDAAIINSGVSRWHNYYVEGIDWLARNLKIDGLYIDDLAFDRTTMKRVRKALDRNRPGALIDLHSANQFNPRDGYANSANLYLEHFPFLDRLWFGEYFDYGSTPDFWLTEVSGIPFGLMSEMLQEPMNPWRGMIYGMTGRAPRVDNRPLWKAWDEFGIVESRMIGYWVPKPPVTTGRPDVLATSYVRNGRTLVALASWAKESAEVNLTIDWAALGLDPGRARMVAPAIDKFQVGATFEPGQAIPVEPGRGWLIVIGQ